MSALKKLGGILALIAGILMLVVLFGAIFVHGFPVDMDGIIRVVVNILLIALILLGAILGIADKTAGGVLLLIIGLLIVVFAILNTPPMAYAMVRPYTIVELFGINPYIIPYVTIEAILIIVDGVLVLAGGSE